MMNLVTSSNRRMRGSNTNFYIDVDWGMCLPRVCVQVVTVSSQNAYGNIILIKLNDNTLGFLTLQSCFIGHSLFYWYNGNFSLFKPQTNLIKITLVHPSNSTVIEDEDFPEIFFCFSNHQI